MNDNIEETVYPEFEDSTEEKIAKRRQEVLKLVQEITEDDNFEMYELVHKIAHNMKMYEIGEEEALNLIYEYYNDIKQMRSEPP